MIKREVIPALLIILMGLMDCVTTIIGVSYNGAKELNPAMAAIVNNSVGAFAAIKIAATMFIALAYIFARKILLYLPSKNGKTLAYSIKALTVAYAGLIGFLTIAVANNILILIR